MDFSTIEKLYMTNPTETDVFQGDVMQIRQGNDILWSRKFDVNVIVSPDGYGTITPDVNGRYDYKTSISFSTVPVVGHKFIRWSDGEISPTHSSVVISSDYALAAIYESPGIDYYDSEETPQTNAFSLQLKPGTYEMILVGAGGSGGRSSAGDWGIRGAFGGGSGAAISGYATLNELSTFTAYIGLETLDTYIKSNVKASYFNILADCGKNGRQGYMVSYGGDGGQKSNCKTIGLDDGYCIWAGKAGKKENIGDSANGGSYATNLLKFGGGQTSGCGNDDIRYPNKGTSYPPQRGYLHVERVYTVSFLDYDGKILKEYFHVRRNTSCEPPSDPSREGYVFQGWSSSEYQNVNSDVVVTALYQNIRILTTRPNDVTFGQTSPSLLSANYDAVVQVSATPFTGYRFMSWSDGGELTHNVTITEAMDLTANFDYDGECP